MIINLTSEEIGIVKQHATKAELGGVSRIRKNDRLANLKIDQLTAQLGEAALSKFLTGNIECYVKTRIEREKTPRVGDKGTDLLGYNADIKSSRMRYGKNFSYHLWVRPKEYHPETLYILGLIEENRDDEVRLAGWVLGKEMNLNGNRYELQMSQLHSMNDWKYIK